MRAGRRRGPSGAAVFAATLICALLAAGSQGFLYYRDRRPTPAVHARVGEPVQLGGSQLVVRSFTVAAELPADDPERPPVRGPAGSMIVLIVYAQQVDATVDVSQHFCDSSLVADDGTEWDEDDAVGYSLRRPEAYTCGDTDSQPLRAGVSRDIGASYLIPARYADQVRWRLSLQDGQQDEDRKVIEFQR